MKNVISVVGARPNFMKVAPISRAFVPYHDRVRHSIVHTGQHYDAAMSGSFLQDLQLPEPDFFLGVGSGSHAEQTAKVLVAFERVCIEQKPDLVIVVGDVNSTIASALAAVKCGVSVAHVEAGLRSGDRSMPEEINRIATDAICEYAFVTEQSGMDNLRNEGWSADRMFHVGNTMIDSLRYVLPAAQKSDIIQKLQLAPHTYVVVTVHRPSNVDDPQQLGALVDILIELAEQRAVVFPAHPRTRKNLERFGYYATLAAASGVHLLEPARYVDFLALMANADFVLTDSGGIQEETTALKIPCITMRTTTERPITCELGANILVDPEAEAVRTAIDNLLTGTRKEGQIPPLWDGAAGERIVKIIVDQCLED